MVDRVVARRGVQGILTESERAALETLPVERRRAEWLAGRLAGKRALRAACRRRDEAVPAYTAIEIRNDARGAPRFEIAERPDLDDHLDISIAHSNGTAVAAIANRLASGTVGVDVEVTKPLPMYLLKRVLRPEEIACLDALSNTAPTALEMWTAKEATLKAARHLCDALRDVELSWTPRRSMRARITGTGLPAHSILVRHRVAGPYTIALAICR
jgi:phosphopantetheinyl transferase (holo-ACP synthase)